MDRTTIIQIVCGVLALLILVVLIQRRRSRTK
jgi:preprotein translocase subunit SecG